jgi:acyl CoA:acetate/3-ketoacid CoA transferase alpha subunit
MVRCNCAASGGCSCSVREGENIRVTGSGEAGNPYVIEALRQTIAGQVTVADTPSLNLTMTGQGMVNEPFTISGEVIPGAQQPITGQLTVSDTASLNLTLAGQGTVADPYTVSGQVLSAPPTSTALGDLTDVDTSGAAVGDSLIYDGTGWAALAARYPTVSATPPPDPFVGQIWFDIS